MHRTVSQSKVRKNIGNKEFFAGGVVMTQNGKDTLYITTAEERQLELLQRFADDLAFERFLKK